ncbi:MAG: FAD-dependent oxidoreductase [Clostridia bacterium]|nr:FAD-dependent oxidoreductase [Clostridia bacterium]
MNKSLWTDKTDLPQFEKLNGNKKTDVLIIGGGLCGILCAYFLKQAGIDYILVEANRIASGITKNTTAKITFAHGLIYSKLIKEFGKEKAMMYFKANQDALEEYKKMCSDLDCDFEIKDSYTYSVNDRKKIENEVEAAWSLGFPAEFAQTNELPFNTSGAICFKNQAQFNPVKFIAEISKDLNIYENTFIRDIKPTSAISDTGKITAKKIIVTTHFPFINTHGNYFLKLYQHRSYVSAFENTPSLRGMYVDENLKGLSFSFHNNLLLLGGGSHRTGKHGENWHELNKVKDKYYPDAKLKYSWSTQDCMSLDSVPYIGKYSKNTPNLFVATGFNKWGMTSSMAAAKFLCNMISGKRVDFAEVFCPQRSILKPQLLVNGFETTKNLLTPTSPRCPHLGCALKWNSAEHSWDCPCHGSRFEKGGKLIDGPATGDLNLR